MMNEKNDAQEAYALVASAIGISIERAKEIERIHEPPEWDSEGHLCIVLSLEELTGTEILEEDTVERLTKMSEIIAFLRASTKEGK